MIELVAKVGEVTAKVVEKTAEVTVKGLDKAGEAFENTLKEVSEQKSIVLKPDIEIIKGRSLKSLMEANNEKATSQTLLETKNHAPSVEKSNLEELGLTEEQKILIMKETGWSPEIINAIESMDQYEVYKNAGLHEEEINGRKCLIKDIDWDYVDEKTGLTNRELVNKGRSPFDATTGERIELHHMGQNVDGPFAELTENSEHGDGKHGILHKKCDESWRNDLGKKNQFQVEKRQHWNTRAKEEV